MKKTIGLFVLALAFLAVGTTARAGSLALGYKLKPGQTWVCTRLSTTEMVVMGRNHTQRNKHTIAYTVSKGPKKGWVRLTARYIDKPRVTDDNRFGLGLYDLVFTADMHSSGEFRNIRVTGTDTPFPDASLDPGAQTAYIQGKQMIAQAHQPAVFWFPELPEDALEPGDEFEYEQNSKMGGAMMAGTTQNRQAFVLDEVVEGLAYFQVEERTVSRVKSVGGDVKTKSAGKGETIFDLETGMWTDIVMKRRMKIGGGTMMAGMADQDMKMMEKIEMQLK